MSNDSTRTRCASRYALVCSSLPAIAKSPGRGSCSLPRSSPLTWKGLEGWLTRFACRGESTELLQPAQIISV